MIAPAGTLAAKKLELLKAAVPGASRASPFSPRRSGIRLQVQETQQAAAALGIKLAVTEVQAGDYERAFAVLAAERPEALFVGAHTFFVRDRARIIALAATHRLPAMYEWPEQVEDGGLMSYGSSLAGTTRRVAAYVDRLFKGAAARGTSRSSSPPVPARHQPQTAQALGLTLPPSLVARADRIIE